MNDTTAQSLPETAARYGLTAYLRWMPRIILLALLGAVGFTAAPAFAHAGDSSVSPDVHVVGVERHCVSNAANAVIYRFHLRNLGDHSRAVDVRIVRRGQTFSESLTRHVRPHGYGTFQRVKVGDGQTAVVTFETQERVVMRTALVGDCRDRATTGTPPVTDVP